MADQKYEAFVRAAKLGSFKKAAQELGYTQAGISYMMNALEHEMGTALFVRDHAGVRLTADGQNLLPWFQDVCAAENALTARLAEIKHVEAGTVRVGAFASIAIAWLPGVLERFAAAHPRVEVSISCYEDQVEAEAAAWNGELDCCFAVLPTARDFFTIPLTQDPIYCVLAPDHPLAHAPYFPREALAMEPYIKIRNESYSEFDAVFDRHEVKPNTRFTMDNDFAIMGMVSKGLGFALFPKLILDESPFELAALEPEVRVHRELGIAVRSYDRASFATKAFVECVRTYVGDLTGK